MPFISILNDVLGPVMRGPSSSHTAGAYRIARLCMDILGAKPTTVTVTFDPDGSMAPTYLPLGVDLAFAAALLGWDMTDDRYGSAPDTLAGTGIKLTFQCDTLPGEEHPNAMRVSMMVPDGSETVIHAKSIGGGVVEIYRIDGREVCISGKEPYKLADRVDGERTIKPVFLVQAGEGLFKSTEEMIRYADAEHCSLGQAALAYETAILGLRDEQILEEMEFRWQVMGNSVEQGLAERDISLSYLKSCARGLSQNELSGRMPFGGLHTRAAVNAIACMHVCNSGGVVCAAPTGGSAGVIPGVLKALCADRDIAQDQLLHGLLAAGAVGLIMAIRGTFAAEEAGCQVEIGVAGAMAAAMLIDIYGGSVDQAADGASISLQNTMGSVCDPVGGGCEIPCHTRNAAAASQAFVTADMVLGGYSNPISLDDSIDASMAVGRSLSTELRCTARGGIAVTPSARKLID